VSNKIEQCLVTTIINDKYSYEISSGPDCVFIKKNNDTYITLELDVIDDLSNVLTRYSGILKRVDDPIKIIRDSNLLSKTFETMGLEK